MSLPTFLTVTLQVLSFPFAWSTKQCFLAKSNLIRVQMLLFSVLSELKNCFCACFSSLGSKGFFRLASSFEILN